MEESSITSVLYVRAKAVYKMRKIFNRNALKSYFNTFMIRTLHQNNKGMNLSISLRRIFALRKILLRNIRKLNMKVFKAFLLNNQTKHT